MIYRIFDEQNIRSFVHITRGGIMASDVRRETNAGLREDERTIEIRAVESSLVLPDRFFLAT